MWMATATPFFQTVKHFIIEILATGVEIGLWKEAKVISLSLFSSLPQLWLSVRQTLVSELLNVINDLEVRLKCNFTKSTTGIFYLPGSLYELCTNLYLHCVSLVYNIPPTPHPQLLRVGEIII